MSAHHQLHHAFAFFWTSHFSRPPQEITPGVMNSLCSNSTRLHSKPCLAMNTFIIKDSKDMYNTIHTSQITSPTLQRIHRHFEETRKHQIMQRNLINDHLSYYQMASFIFDEQSLLVQSMAHL